MVKILLNPLHLCFPFLRWLPVSNLGVYDTINNRYIKNDLLTSLKNSVFLIFFGFFLPVEFSLNSNPLLKLFPTPFTDSCDC